jgi:hypothetical protein
MKEYLVKPKFEQNVSERTIYTNYGGKFFTIERYYRTVDIIVKCDEEPFIDIDLVFGENLVEYLINKYPGCEVEYSIFHRSGIDYPLDMPEYLRERMLEDPCYDLTKDGWDVVETELWGYTHFSVSTFEKSGAKSAAT